MLLLYIIIYLFFTLSYNIGRVASTLNDTILLANSGSREHSQYNICGRIFRRIGSYNKRITEKYL